LPIRPTSAHEISHENARCNGGGDLGCQDSRLRPAKSISEAVTFAKKVTSANTLEIQSSELAMDQAHSSNVKSLAEQMIKGYTKAGKDLKSAVAKAQISTPAPEEPDAGQKSMLAKLKNTHACAFDEACVSAQLAAHKEAVSLFGTHARSGRAAPLKRFAQSTLLTLEHHLSMTQQLSDPSGVASRQAPTGCGKGSGGAPAQTSLNANRP